MIRTVNFANHSFAEFMEWSKEDKKILQRIARIIEECRRTPFEGIGKPEALKGELKGCWSRRIDDKNRIVYQINDDEVIIHSLKGHYDDH
jgi:toxin YoeB